MQGELSAGKVVVSISGSEVEDSAVKGYGRKRGSKGELELLLEEAAFLLEREKIWIKDEEDKELNFEEFLKRALDISPKFVVRYIVYKDLKERGYAVKPGKVGFWLYPRGSKPGEKPARYFIRISSEREVFTLKELAQRLLLARNMRKEVILAVVDEESDITYYVVKEVKFEFSDKNKEEGREEEKEKEKEMSNGKATLLGDRVILWDTDLSEMLYEDNFYGKLTEEKRLHLSLVESAYLQNKSYLSIEVKGEEMSFEKFIKYAKSVECDFMDKYEVYKDLRDKGLIVKTGFKFGSHFRVYDAITQKHSSYLIHVVPKQHVFTSSELSRAVRLAHSVKKRMIFPYKYRYKYKQKGGEESLKYVDVGRMKL